MAGFKLNTLTLFQKMHGAGAKLLVKIKMQRVLIMLS